MPPSKGLLALTLHAHLPFVRHPESDEFLEEDWLFEAIIETYIPLLSVFEGLKKDGVSFRLTMTLSPTLISMLKDELLQRRFLKRLDKLLELCEQEIERTTFSPEFNDLARMYHWRFSEGKKLFEDRYGLDLVNAFRAFQDDGSLEIITSAATHGYLPLLAVNESAVRAQIKVAADQYEQTFGRRARGIWLPECGYQPGFEKILKEEGILFFFTDAHGVLHADPRPRYGVYAPIYTKDGVAVFGRDVESSRQVWSARDGYPGDPVYRDFYRDIGFDLDYDYIKPYIQATGDRKMTGVKYHRITNRAGGQKEIYVQRDALARASEHAEDFVRRRLEQIDRLAALIDRPPLIVAPYDAELFGHWWYEGPEFLNFMLRKISAMTDRIETITPYDYLQVYSVNQVAAPAASSWGSKGYAEVWLDESNDWIYRHLHKAADRMVELAAKYLNGNGSLVERALNQAARELLLAQSSDWAFIMKTGTMSQYAVKRTKEHLLRFNRLYEEVTQENIDEAELAQMEKADNIFPDMNYRIYAEKAG
ncbi:MAG: DUF1957 domain-containing protein [Nitrospinae bacterium]|nr:DUF1957 domain-containing protein [Nitrospinota bacterium]